MIEQRKKNRETQMKECARPGERKREWEENRKRDWIRDKKESTGREKRRQRERKRELKWKIDVK